MNKKIIAIGIVGIFLLTGLTTVSATQVETTDLKTNSTADLTVYYMLGIGFIANADVTAYNDETQDTYVLEYHHSTLSYSIEGIPTGEYTITATHYFYQTTSKDVTLHEGKNIVRIPTFIKSKSAQPAFFRLIDQFPNAFPLLRLLLKI